MEMATEWPQGRGAVAGRGGWQEGHWLFVEYPFPPLGLFEVCMIEKENSVTLTLNACGLCPSKAPAGRATSPSSEQTSIPLVPSLGLGTELAHCFEPGRADSGESLGDRT